MLSPNFKIALLNDGKPIIIFLQFEAHAFTFMVNGHQSLIWWMHPGLQYSRVTISLQIGVGRLAE